MTKQAGYYNQWQKQPAPEPKEPIYLTLNQYQITINVQPAIFGYRQPEPKADQPPEPKADQPPAGYFAQAGIHEQPDQPPEEWALIPIPSDADERGEKGRT